MTELWSAGTAIPEVILRQAYLILGIFVFGFVLLEAVYVVALAVVVTRWKADSRRPRRPLAATQESSGEQEQTHTSRLHKYAVATPR